MNIEKLNLHPSWKAYLSTEFNQTYMKELSSFINKERKSTRVFPPRNEVFSAFQQSSFHKLKVIIVGQDPYHGEGQAHGLSFSVKPGVKTPPSLRNIYKELLRDLKIPVPNHGNLNDWAKQGVLLLNAVLSVREGEAASHQKKGWETFTDKVISELNENREKLVFMLWGNYAKKKGKEINRKKHLVLESGHPSPLSVRFFLGNGHFSKANRYLKKNNQKEINWQLKDIK